MNLFSAKTPIKSSEVNANFAEAVAGWYSKTGLTLTYSSADAPTYVVSTNIDMTGYISVGMKMKMTHGGSVKYFFVTAITSNSITLYGGTDYTLAATAITLPYFSNIKAPLGFPISPIAWTVESKDTSLRSQVSPVAGTYYNLGSVGITFPIGIWNFYGTVTAQALNTSIGTSNDIRITLSTANNSESDSELSAMLQGYGAANNGTPLAKISIKKVLVIATKTTYYLNSKQDNGPTTIYNRGDIVPTLLRATSAYL